MNKAWRLGFALVVLACLVRQECKAQVYVTFDNGTARGPFSSGEPILSSDTRIGNIPTTVTLIHIYAINPATTDVGRIDLAGDPLFSRQTELQVLISNQATNNFPQAPDAPLSAGGHHWHGISFSDTDLRSKARLAASVGGDLVRRNTNEQGNVQVGQVFHLQLAGVIREQVLIPA